MSNPENVLGSNNSDVFAKPFLQDASLLDNSPIVKFQQTLGQFTSGQATALPTNPDQLCLGKPKALSSDPLAFTSSSLLSNPAAAVPLVTLPGTDPLTGNTIRSQPTGSAIADLLPTSRSPLPAYSIMAEGTVTINGGGDFDGDPFSSRDDALIYAGAGFAISGQTELPVQRDANGNPLLDASGRPILVNYAVSVAPGYGMSTVNGSRYAGLVPPPVVPKQTVNVPAFAELQQQELTQRIPAGTSLLTFDAQSSSIRTATDWTRWFPAAGTASQPTVVRVVNGGLNIPANVNLSNTIIIVERGDITVSGSGHNFNNVVLLANNGNINLANVQATHFSALASGSITMSGGARFNGSTLLANGSGDLTFNGATKNLDTTQNLRVISQGNLTYNGASDTRSLFLSAKNFTDNGTSTLYGAIAAKGNILFNGKSAVTGVTEINLRPQPPIITANLAHDTAPGGTINTDRITYDPTIAGAIAVNNPGIQIGTSGSIPAGGGTGSGAVTTGNQIIEFTAGFDQTAPEQFIDVVASLQVDGTFRLNREQLNQIYGGVLPDGSHVLHLQATDLYGNVTSFDVALMLDTTTPSPILTLLPTSDSGQSNQDRITQVVIPTISGTAEAGATVQLVNDNQVVGQTIAAANGTWQVTPPQLSDGIHQFTAIATDIAGNVNTSQPLGVTVDTVQPQVNLTTPLETAPLQNNARLTGMIDGTGSAIATLSYHFGTGAEIPLTLDASGSFDQALDFTGIYNGTHTLTLTAIDIAGNASVSQYNVLVDLDTTPPAISAGLERDTAPSQTTNTDLITADPTITGIVTDVSQIMKFRAAVDATTESGFVDVTANLQSDGRFTFSRAQLEVIKGQALADGVHTLHLQATDQWGNQSFYDFTFTLDTTPPTVSFGLDSTASNTEPQTTSASLVILTGQTEANTLLLLQETGATTISDATGRFSFSGVSLEPGNNVFHILATDIAGNEGTGSRIITQISNNRFTLTEGQSFQVTFDKSLVELQQPTQITFSYDASFDTTDLNDIRDAFEVVLVDLEGNSLIHTIGAGRDAFFNLTEGLPAVLGAAASLTSNTVTVTLPPLPVGQTAHLIFRLVNNDQDTHTTVTVYDLQTQTGATGVISAPLSIEPTFSSRAIDFSRLSDVSPSLAPEYGRTSFNADTHILYSDLSIQNQGLFDLQGPLLVVVNHLSDPNVKLLNADGFTPDGLPYYDFTQLISGNFLAPGQGSQARTLNFYNPGDIQFTYDLQLLAPLNRPPVITSTPEGEALIGQSYTYNIKATDPDADTLSYTLLAGPEGMSLDATTGKLLWVPTLNDVGAHSITIQVQDNHGAQEQQVFNLNVVDGALIPNRPPVFISSPIVSASINQPYVYQAIAQDADKDALSFTLVSGPTGLTVNAQTGVIHWVPDGTQLGTYDVVLRVSDGRGGVAEQRYKIQTAAELSNRAPFIVSEPEIQFNVLRTSVPQLIKNSSQLGSSQPDLASVHGQVFLDVNGDGRREASTYVSTTYVDFSDLSAFSFNGTAASINSTSVIFDNKPVLRLTNSYGQAGTALLKAPIPLKHNDTALSFHTNFQFQITSPGGIGDEDGPGADGITFVIAPTSILGSAGGGIGYGGVGRSVAIEFDTYNNGYVDGYKGNHVGINLNGDLNSVVRQHINSRMNNGAIWYSWIDYDGPNHQLEVRLSQTSERPVDALLSYKVDIPSILSQPNAYVGFTSGTGAGIGTHDIRSWAFDIQKFVQEPGLDGATVKIIDQTTGKLTESQITFSSDLNNDGRIDPVTEQGLYRFENVKSGTYEVYQTQRDGWQQTVPVSSYVVTLNSGSRIENQEFGNAKDYFYSLQAIDPDGDTLTYHLLSGPEGTTIDPQNGRINWFPTSIGDYEFRMLVEDGRGGQASQNFTLSVLDSDANTPPVITSPPPIRTLTERTFTHKITAIDFNYDSLLFDLIEAPTGMAIDASTGVITWQPSQAQVGLQPVTVRVQDGRGGQTSQKFDLSVVSDLVNQSPEFKTTPQTNAVVGQFYQYGVIAQDPDQDKLSFDLVVKPVGMTIDPASGELLWIPTPDQVGVHSVVLRTQDGYGGVALQSFEIRVGQPSSGPIITSHPRRQAISGFPYQYQSYAQDAESTKLAFRLNVGPSGMSINSTTGLVNWTPTSDQLGDHLVTIAVRDSDGRETNQRFVLSVVASAPNDVPVILSQPRSSIALGKPYFYTVQASDPNSDPLTYTLDTAPQGMTLDNSGRLYWNPNAAQLGSHPVSLTVSDGRGGVVTQSFNLEVVSASNFTNQAPSITSAPILTTTVGELYEYDLSATDLDNDVVGWTLDQAPIGMSIDPQNGMLLWAPTTSQLGEHNIVIRAQDSLGAVTTQTFTLKVRPVDTPPVILSSPGTLAAQNKLYSYLVQADDLEHDPLVYSLVNSPSGMSIDAQIGLIQWIPTSTQLGQHDITVLVDDGQGGTATQSYRILVGETAVNLPPSITSQPIYVAAADQPYQYQISAQDPEGAPLQFGLKNAPLGMTIDAATGLVQWTPTAAQVGSYTIQVLAQDVNGAIAAQNFNLDVRVNHAPILLSQPLTQVVAGLSYRYDLRASDLDQDPLSYSLEVGPQGMTVDALGRIAWTPGAQDLGTHNIVLAVKDSRGATTRQSYTLSVVADTQAPKVSLFATQTVVDTGSSVTLIAAATDNVKVAGLQLSVGNRPVILDARGRATVQLTELGDITATAIATDGAGNQGLATTTIQVIDPYAAFDPDLNFDLPDVVTAPTQFKVAGTGVVSYKLEVAPVAGGEWRTLVAKRPISSDGMGTFDPSLLENDTYITRLTLYGANGDEVFVEDEVSVAGDLKLGNFRLSFTDLSIPVTGIPITLTRTYDSLTANTTDDFGYGWRMEFRDTDLRTSLKRDPELEALGFYPAFKQGTRVYITLPSGKREGFTFKPVGDRLNRFFGAAPEAALYHPAFVADKGVTSTLTVKDARMVYNSDTNRFYGLEGVGYNPEDPLYGGIYTLTTKDGTAYDIDARTGDLLTVTDTNGNTLTFTDTAITSSTGQQITFERDAQNRITSVKDPMGELIRYTYDAKGDLVAVSDRENNTTRMEYNDERSHYLDKIIDPLGRTGVKTEYDQNGRLVEMVDAGGKAVQLDYDPANSKQTVIDQLGHATTYVYDDRGNVVTEIDALGKVTQRQYDDNNYVLKETVISDRSGSAGFTTSYTYDGLGNQLTQTDALGNTTYYTYGDRSRLLTETDALGRTTIYTYSPSGNLRFTKDAAGNLTSYGYDLKGQLLGVTDAKQQTTRFSYNAAGQVVSVVDALGNTTAYTYNANGDKLSETRQMTTAAGLRTLVTTWSYDHAGRVTSVTDAENQTTRYEYNALGQQTAVIDALNRRTEYRYNDKGELVETIYPDSTPEDLSDNVRTGSQYDAAGRTIATTDAAGRVTNFVYDAVGRLIATIYPDGTPEDLSDNPTSRTEYYSDGLVKAQIDERGSRTEYRYDAAGRQIEVIYADATPATLADNPKTRYEYDRTGQQTAVTDALNHTTRYVYDSLGRLTNTRFQDGTSTSNTYDVIGRRVTTTDQNGKTTEYRYDALGRLTGVKDALSQWTEYGYNELGNLIWQEDANDHATRYEYDGVGRRTATVLPLGQRSLVTYDAVGNLHSMTDFNGETTLYRYDEQNRLIEKDFDDDPTVTMTYTHNGLVETITDGRGITHFEYDERDRLTKRIDPDGKWIAYGYDVAGNRTLVKTALGETRYTFNERNWLDTVIAAGGVTDYGYNAIGLLVHTRLANGTEENRRYDDLNRLVYLENKELDGDFISSYTYTLDKVGNRLSVTENSGRKVNYTYDALYRLTQEEILDAVNGNRTFGYVYDAVGNRLTKMDSAEGTMTYTYDANDRLLAEKVDRQIKATYTYDDNGNTLTKTEIGQETRYTWDDQNRLVAADIMAAAGTKHLEYQYDINGIRVASSVDGQEVRYLIDTVQLYAQVVEEYASDGAIQMSYVYGTALILQMHYDSQTKAGTTAYYHVDGLGSTTALTDESGNSVSYYRYDAFGETIEKTGTTENKYLFVGEQYDSDLEDYYLRDRYYDAENGRFIRRDMYEGRINEPMTLHKYLYAHGNPVNFSDPTGLFTIGEFSAANAIRSTLSEINIDAGSRFLATTSGGSSFDNDFVTDLAISLAIPLAVPVIGAFIKALRQPAQSILDQGGWLWRHEDGLGGSSLGHTIDRHVGKSITDLTNRFNTSRISKSSSFPDALTAEKVIKEAILQNRADIRVWLTTPGSDIKKAFRYSGNGSIIGYGVTRGNSTPVDLSNAKIVLKKRDPNNPSKGFFILTAHPE